MRNVVLQQEQQRTAIAAELVAANAEIVRLKGCVVNFYAKRALMHSDLLCAVSVVREALERLNAAVQLYTQRVDAEDELHAASLEAIVSLLTNFLGQ